MGKALLNIDILNKNYCVFESKEGTNLNASFYDKRAKVFGFVTDEKELTILNEIVRKLNRKYVRRRDIIFNDENFIRYVNRYTGMSYFARMENGIPESCPYIEYKDLYNKYNCKQIFCMPRKPKRKQINNYDYNYGNDFGSYAYNNFGDNSAYNRRYKGHRSNGGIAKKILISIAGVAVVVTIGLGGYKVLSTGNLPEIDSAEQVVEEIREAGISIENFNIQADTEDEKRLKAKYDSILEQFKAAGLEPWQIAVELDLISIFDDDKEDISFYYDSDKDEVVYVYGNLQREDIETAVTEETTSSEVQVSANVQKIINAIESNTKLSSEEKRHIIDTYAPIWCKNEKYLNIYELINRYSILETEFDFTEGGKILEGTLEYNPHEYIAGTYSHMGILAQGEEDLGNCFQSKITIYDSASFDDTLKDADSTSTYDHETNHVNGNLSYYSADLLNEGYTQLSQANSSNRYKVESAMAMLCIETFGNEAFKEGYYGFDLQTVLTNKIVGITKRDANKVDSELYNLFQDIEAVLYSAGRDPNYKENSEILEQFEDIFNRLSVYHELITGREMGDNQAANIIEDYITGSRRSSLYGRDSVGVKDIILDYDLDKKELNAQIDVGHKELSYSVSFVEARMGERSF